jgi:hypothetical protein
MFSILTASLNSTRAYQPTFNALQDKISLRHNVSLTTAEAGDESTPSIIESKTSNFRIFCHRCKNGDNPNFREHFKGVGIAMDSTTGIWFLVSVIIFSTAPNRLWGPPGHLSSWYQGLFCACVRPAPQFHLVLRSTKVELYLHCKGS